MALYRSRELERAMRIQEVILRAIGKQISWTQAAEIIGVSPRTMRRWRGRYEEYGYDGLFDRRLKRPSPKRDAGPTRIGARRLDGLWSGWGWS